jgi:hypothetical protein
MTDKSIFPAVNLHKILRYDPESGKLYWLFRSQDAFKSSENSSFKRWNTRWAGKEAFTTTDLHGYKTGVIWGRRYMAHRVIMAMLNGEWPPQDVDHINGNRSDNFIKNLRLASRKENSRNAARPSTNTSGHVGVSWSKKDKRWRAGICVDGREIYLGNFVEISDAIKARLEAEKIYGFHSGHGRAST